MRQANSSSLHDPHRQVDRLHILRQLADRDSIDAGGSNHTDGSKVNTTGDFKLGTPGIQRDRGLHVVEREVVEKDTRCARIERLAEFVEVLDLDLDV